MNRRWRAILTAVVVALVMIFGWPTLYRYDTFILGSTHTVARTNRITGQTYILYRSGWTVAQPSDASRPSQ